MVRVDQLQVSICEAGEEEEDTGTDPLEVVNASYDESDTEKDSASSESEEMKVEMPSKPAVRRERLV